MSFGSRQRHHGFTLFEVLIAVLVLSIGLLGIGAMQFASLQFNHSAHLRSQATALAYDMTDRLRANRAPARSGAYDDAGMEQAQCDPGFVPNGNASIAEQDVAAWRNDLACLLPNGQGSVNRDGAVFRVTVQWEDARDGADGEAEELQFIVETEL